MKDETQASDGEASPVFVVGSGRCGTTILDQSIGMHSQFESLPFEAQVLVSPDMRNGLVRAFQDPPGNKRNDLIRAHLQNRFSFRHNGRSLGFCSWTTKDAYTQMTEDLLRDINIPASSIRTFLDKLYAPYLSMTGARFWVDGTPANGCITKEIVKIYPEAKFVHPIRNGIEVARSIVRKGWKGGSFERALHHWNVWVSRTRYFGNSLGSDRYMEIDFQSLTRDPAAEILKVSSFLGVEMEGSMLNRFSPTRANIHKLEYKKWEIDLLQKIAPCISEEFGWIRHNVVMPPNCRP